MKTEMGAMMREILRDYREHIARPYEGAAFVKPAMYGSIHSPAFILIPFSKRYERQYIVYRYHSFEEQYWVFTVLPF